MDEGCIVTQNKYWVTKDQFPKLSSANYKYFERLEYESELRDIITDSEDYLLTTGLNLKVESNYMKLPENYTENGMGHNQADESADNPKENSANILNDSYKEDKKDSKSDLDRTVLYRGEPNKVEAKVRKLFTEFYGENYLKSTRLAYLMMNDKTAAEDIAQDSFLALYLRYERLENPEGYLRTVVINKCKTALKKKTYDNRKIRAIADKSNRENELNLSDSDDFLNQLGVLSVKQKTAVILRYYLRFSDAEVANVIKCRPSSVSKIISRALEKLKVSVDL
jgi:RNA polymerase sigma factor (sigma-70 family)